MTDRNTNLRRKGGTRGAFTLIEMLVVIVVILVLIGLIAGVARYLLTDAHRRQTEATMDILMHAITAYGQVAGGVPYNGEENPDKTLRWPGVWNAKPSVPQSGSVLLAALRGEWAIPAPPTSGDPKTVRAQTEIYNRNLEVRTQVRKRVAPLLRDLPTDAMEPDKGDICVKDAWGRPLKYDYSEGSGGGYQANRVWSSAALTSAGADGNMNTANDNIVKRY